MIKYISCLFFGLLLSGMVGSLVYLLFVPTQPSTAQEKAKQDGPEGLVNRLATAEQRIKDLETRLAPFTLENLDGEKSPKIAHPDGVYFVFKKDGNVAILFPGQKDAKWFRNGP